MDAHRHAHTDERTNGWTDRRMNGRTHDGHKAMTIACWPSASGAKNYGKRRYCSLRAISPFPTVFSEDMNCRHVTTRACLGKG